MKLPNPKDDREAEAYRQIELADKLNHKKGVDVEINGGNATRKPRLILVSPNGTRWSITVSNAGAISAASI